MKLGCLSSQAWAALRNLVGAFSGHCETSRRFVDSSSACGAQSAPVLGIFASQQPSSPPPPSAKCAPTLRNRWRAAGLGWMYILVPRPISLLPDITSSSGHGLT